MNGIHRESRETIPSIALNAHEAAKCLGISERHLRTLTKKGDIPHVRLGHRTVWPCDALRAFLQDCLRYGERPSETELN
jgi:excisionase family DNA binding protein